MHGNPFRTILVAVIAALVLGLGVAASASAAAPSYSEWSAPVNVGAPVNTPGTIQGPALSADGLSLYFVPGFSTATVFGLQDIYVSQRASVTSAWGTPTNLGATINTAAQEFVPLSRPTVTGCSSPATDRPQVRSASPTSTSRTARTCTTTSAGSHRSTSARTSTRSWTTTGSATSTT